MLFTGKFQSLLREKMSSFLSMGVVQWATLEVFKSLVLKMTAMSIFLRGIIATCKNG